MTLGFTLRSMCHTHHTLTTHRQGRAVVSSDDDGDDGGEDQAASGGRAGSGDDVDWENIDEDE